MFIKNNTWTQGNLFAQSQGPETQWSLNSPISWGEPAVSGAMPLMVCLSPDQKHIHVLMTSKFFNFPNHHFPTMPTTYLVIICNTAIRCGSHDLRCGGSQVTRTHDAGFGNTEAQYQVIPPQRHIAISRAWRAGLFGVNGTAANVYKRKGTFVMFFPPVFVNKIKSKLL